MGLFRWETKYSVGNIEMDNHHQRLFQIINSLHEAMLEGNSKRILEEIFTQLIDYTQFHFSAEEEYMKAMSYPQLLEHQVQHTAFINRVIEYRDDFVAGNSNLSLQVMNFLRDWLINHILGSDKKYKVN